MRPQPFPAWAWSSTAALKVSRACPTSTTKCWPAPLLAFPPEAAGIACQISLMSEAPALIGALGFVALTPVFIFKAGKGWVFFFSLSLSLPLPCIFTLANGSSLRKAPTTANWI